MHGYIKLAVTLGLHKLLRLHSLNFGAAIPLTPKLHTSITTTNFAVQRWELVLCRGVLLYKAYRTMMLCWLRTLELLGLHVHLVTFKIAATLIPKVQNSFATIARTLPVNEACYCARAWVCVVAGAAQVMCSYGYYPYHQHLAKSVYSISKEY